MQQPNSKDQLKKVLIFQKKCYGKPSRPRNLDPSMSFHFTRQQILSWKDDENKSWHFKKPDGQSPNDKYINKIKKSADPFNRTQYRDQFPQYSYDQKKQTLLMCNQILVEVDPVVCHQLQMNQKKQGQTQLHLKRKFQCQTQYINDYTIRKLQNEKQLKQYIKNKKTKSKSRERQLTLDQKKDQGKQLYTTQQKQIKSKESKKNKVPKQDEQSLQKRKARIQNFKKQSRNLPNTSFKTYFGKPPFQNYGRINTHNSGGIVYGNYLKSHNVMPHFQDNRPETMQTFNSAIKHAKNIKESMPRKYTQQIGNFKYIQSNDPDKNYVQGKFEIAKPNLIKSSNISNTLDQKKLRENEVQLRKSVVKKPKKENIFRQNNKQQNEKKKLKTNSIHEIKKQKLNKKKKKEEQLIQLENEGLKFLNIRQKRFLKQYFIKKEKNTHIAPKVTQLVHEQEKENKKKQQTIIIEQEELEELQKNPKYYKNLQKKWLARIPPAGKSKISQYYVSDIL